MACSNKAFRGSAKAISWPKNRPKYFRRKTLFHNREEDLEMNESGHRGCPFIFDSTIRWSAIEASENSAWNYIGKQTGGERKE